MINNTPPGRDRADRPDPAPETHRHPGLLSRILVAEDEHLVALELAADLSDLGYTVVGPVADGLAALKLARRELPDLALLDIRMPKLDGLRVARELLQSLDIPCVIISAYSESEYIHTAGDAGVFGYLVKPALGDQLRACIGLAWERFRRFTQDRTETSALRKRLHERHTIEHAKWILVSRRSLSEPDAMKALRKAARDSQRPLVEVADEIVRTESPS